MAASTLRLQEDVVADRTAPTAGPGPLISTKLRAPALVSSYRDRARIADVLASTLDEGTRLTLLSAPPGYGKSAAVAGWLAASGVPSSWLSLDAGDNDPVRFDRYLAAAIARVRPVEAGRPITRSSDAASVIDAMGATDDPFVLVVDDYHVITAEPVHGLMRALIDQGPPFAHLVVVTREDPPFPLARLRAHGRLVELRAADLRYRGDEADAYLAEATGLELDPSEVDRLVERTEGWIAGLQLAAISLRGRLAPAPEIDALTGSDRYVFDYLADEVLGRLDPELREFLVRCSVAERFTAGLAQALTGRADSERLLDRASRMNLFLITLDQECRWFRFHHLFADYLRTFLDGGEEARLRERAAAWLEGEGLLDEAIGQATTAGATERAIRLLERRARATYESGELTTLLRWLDGLPADRVAASAELVSLRALSYFMVGRIADAARTCAEGEAAHPASPAVGPLLRVRASIAAFSLDPAAVALARAALASVGEDPFYRTLALQALASAQLASGDLVGAIDSATQAVAAARADPTHSMPTTPALISLATALDLTGRRREAEAICRQCLEDHRAEARRLAGGTPYEMYWLGTLRYEAGDVAAALHELERGWAAAGTFGFGRAMFTSAVSYLALARMAAGSPEAALDAVRTIRRDARAAGLTGVEGAFDEIEARLHLGAGDLGRAGRWADAAGPPLLATAGQIGGWHALQPLLTLGRVRLAQGRLDDAGDALDRATAISEAAGDVADLISACVLAAGVAWRSGQRSEAIRRLEAAVRLAGPDGYVRRLVDDGAVIAELLPAVRRVDPRFVDQVAVALRPPTAPDGRSVERPAILSPDDAALLEPLTDRELEVLGLMAKGRSDGAIARELFVSLATAKWHAAHIRAKLGVASRTQAVLRAQELGLV
jgi:ATP/maltotriose-dependent transcriptional regulator MalT